MQSERAYSLLAKGLVERIGLQEGEIKHQAEGKEVYIQQLQIKSHTHGMQLLLDALVHSQYGVIQNLSCIEAVGHRLVHGAEAFHSSVLITPEVLQAVEGCTDLAPLHNPANLKGVSSIQAILPNIPQVGVFDTAFHQTMPPYAYLYALPYAMYKEQRVRKYGFHGTSHRYVSAKAAEIAGIPLNRSKIITCHIGNGGSLAAVLNGSSVDTSMGFTPLDGLIMGTRSGALDPGILFYLSEKLEMSVSELSDLLNKQSGVLGISGISSDMRDLVQANQEGNAQAKLALQMYAYRIKLYIGSYLAVLNGADVLVFTGGVGENNALIRSMICEGLDNLGISIDENKNKDTRGNGIISTIDSKVTVMVISTNEELVIALDTMNLVTKK